MVDRAVREKCSATTFSTNVPTGRVPTTTADMRHHPSSVAMP
jgi:hypothetical protein